MADKKCATKIIEDIILHLLITNYRYSENHAPVVVPEKSLRRFIRHSSRDLRKMLKDEGVIEILNVLEEDIDEVIPQKLIIGCLSTIFPSLKWMVIEDQRKVLAIFIPRINALRRM